MNLSASSASVMTDVSTSLRGLVFAKQFPNAAEPLRGLFVAEQVLATRDVVDWRVISAVPWVPRPLAGVLGKPYVRGAGEFDGITVRHPRYPVLPRRLLYSSVAPAVAICSRRAFADVVRDHRPQFVHVHALYPSGAAARRLLERTNVPYVVTIHGSDLYSNLAHERWREELRRTVSAAAAVVCVSDALARDAVELVGADPARTVVIPDTYDETLFQHLARPTHDGPVRLITVGRLVPVKGFDLLIKAVGQVLRAGIEVRLDIVGDGPERASLEGSVAREGLGGSVRFRGSLRPDELVAALRDADAYVLASRSEGFGVALVEALATGLPAVATRSGGPESIVSETDGILVAPDDVDALAAGLGSLVAGLATYDNERIAEGVRRRFGREVIGARLTSLYRAIVDEGVSEYLREGDRRV